MCLRGGRFFEKLQANSWKLKTSTASWLYYHGVKIAPLFALHNFQSQRKILWFPSTKKWLQKTKSHSNHTMFSMVAIQVSLKVKSSCVREPNWCAYITEKHMSQKHVIKISWIRVDIHLNCSYKDTCIYDAWYMQLMAF